MPNLSTQKASLEIELIGHNTASLLRGHWFSIAKTMGRAAAETLFGRLDEISVSGQVSRVISVTPLETEEIYGKKDYSRANSKGSRGIYGYYILSPGEIYLVCERVSWKRTDCYFCIVEDGRVQRIDEENLKDWYAEFSDRAAKESRDWCP